jgi:hypothetical protein
VRSVKLTNPDHIREIRTTAQKLASGNKKQSEGEKESEAAKVATEVFLTEHRGITVKDLKIGDTVIIQDATKGEDLIRIQIDSTSRLDGKALQQQEPETAKRFTGVFPKRIFKPLV